MIRAPTTHPQSQEVRPKDSKICSLMLLGLLSNSNQKRQLDCNNRLLLKFQPLQRCLELKLLAAKVVDLGQEEVIRADLGLTLTILKLQLTVSC